MLVFWFVLVCFYVLIFCFVLFFCCFLLVFVFLIGGGTSHNCFYQMVFLIDARALPVFISASSFYFYSSSMVDWFT